MMIIIMISSRKGGCAFLKRDSEQQMQIILVLIFSTSSFVLKEQSLTPAPHRNRKEVAACLIIYLVHQMPLLYLLFWQSNASISIE